MLSVLRDEGEGRTRVGVGMRAVWCSLARPRIALALLVNAARRMLLFVVEMA